MAFAPDYATTGRFYVYFTTQPDGDLQIREFHRSAADPYVADALDGPARSSPSRTRGRQPQRRAAPVRPDGTLYAGTGDGGGGGDQVHHAQDPSSLLGKLLADRHAAGGPPSSPRGLRNPWRFSFDAGRHARDRRRRPGPTRGGDVGLRHNYGWPC